MQNSPEYMIELERLHGRKSFGTGTGVAKILKKFLDSTPDIESILEFLVVAKTCHLINYKAIK